MKNISIQEAKEIGDKLNINWEIIELEQFMKGINVELEHGTIDQNTNVTNDDPILTGKIALAHLNESPRYYEFLEEMENEMESD